MTLAKRTGVVHRWFLSIVRLRFFSSVDGCFVVVIVVFLLLSCASDLSVHIGGGMSFIAHMTTNTCNN